MGKGLHLIENFMVFGLAHSPTQFLSQSFLLVLAGLFACDYWGLLLGGPGGGVYMVWSLILLFWYLLWFPGALRGLVWAFLQ